MRIGEIGKGTVNIATQVTAINPGRGNGITHMKVTGTRTITITIAGLTMTTVAQEDTVTAAHLASVPMTSTVMIEIIEAIETIMTDIQTPRGGVRMNTVLRITIRVEEGIHRTSEGCLITGDRLEIMAPQGPITTAPSTQTNPHPSLIPVPLKPRNPLWRRSHLQKELQSRNL